MNKRLDELIDLLDIERIEVNLFRGRSPSDRWQRVFGGQVIGQALVAASRTNSAVNLQLISANLQLIAASGSY